MRRPDGDIDALHCEVKPEPPHRITMTWISGVVPTDLAPRLPIDFADYDLPSSCPAARAYATFS
ncbi:hypothetical protein [Thermasporomyces composti]|uniref:hypothetical protein n=1 Tax=Thermasporomyces composti TaxID=696763 RepID=UPI000E23BDB1|nr:hypothetical protein [Thermasporomyces composti]